MPFAGVESETMQFSTTPDPAPLYAATSSGPDDDSARVIPIAIDDVSLRA